MKSIIDWAKRNDRGLYIIVTLLSIIAFFSIYGFRILNPIYTDWLLAGGDLSQHYLGWVAYRISEWHFPIGLTDLLAYPNYTSVIFTDSIPIFAVIFKVLSPLLPESFQYFGLWGIICFLLQGIFSARIIRKYTDSYLAVSAGSLLIVLTPTVFYRLYGHEALAGQWIIVFTLDLIFSYEKYSASRKKLYSTIIAAGILSVSIHMYFLIMCGILVFSYCVMDVIHRRKIRRALSTLLTYCAAAFITIWLLGGFVATGSTYEAEGLGYHNTNLNSLYNPMGVSSILQNLPSCKEGQYEGFGYLGFGVMLLLFTAVICLIVNEGNLLKTISAYREKLISIFCVCLLTLVVSVQTVVSFGERELYVIRLPKMMEKIWGIFRSSGRMVMVINYALAFSCIAIIAKLYRRRASVVAALLTICLAFQAYDLRAYFAGIHLRYSTNTEYVSPLSSEIWDAVAENDAISHLVVTCWLGTDNYYTLGQWALSNHLSMNSFAMVHASRDKLLGNLDEHLNHPSADEIFLFDADDLSLLSSTGCALNYYYADDYILGYAGELTGMEKLKIPSITRTN